ncbi:MULTISPECIES: transcription antitermination factor NusB [Campylobacter]|uniref:transcription antitermination factor NusB n=1 Tax=Campylobacter TaxID=194 RepID=UPI000A343B66|nr:MULTISPECIES: transcription antitermination factor NusB [unclassified Campylobacter]MCR8679080.1 transcription antitermination factor NusB [Campylobacter sp. RM19072]MCR8696177.1 transcription antitermination factor NusB [Campylobacter sp. RM19073]
MATRHQVRQSVVSLLYAKEMGSEMEQFSNEYLEEKKIRNDQKNFTIALYNGILDNLNSIDTLLNNYLGKWKLDQIGSVERQILRLGAYEMRYSDIDLAIVINEAVILANELSSESSIKLINGVLDAIAKELK